ncbi:MAG: flagellar basal body P-ring formation chaperone FlgA [Pusillimonas sp.]
MPKLFALLIAVCVCVTPRLVPAQPVTQTPAPAPPQAAQNAPPASSAPTKTASTPAEASDLPETVVAAMEQIRFFIEDMAISWPGELSINITPPDFSRQAECHDLEVFMSGRQGLRPRMNVGIRCTSPGTWVVYTPVSVKLTGVYYVTSRTINAGTLISLDDLIPLEGDLLALPAGSLLDPGQLVGYITTQRLAARRPIRASALRSPDSVERGQRVRIEVRGTGFVASSDGHAMQGGEPGTQIQVRTASGQIVTATVLNAQTVLIPM